MVYSLFFAFLIIGALFIKGRAMSHRFLVIVMSLFFAIIGFRDVTVGADTLSYTKDFTGFAQMTFAQIWSYAMSYKEPLYVIISWLPSIITDDYILFLLIWAFFPSFSLFKIFKYELDNSKDYLIAIVVLFIIGLFAFFVAGIRQTAALSIILISYRYLSKIPTTSIRILFLSSYLYKFLLLVFIAFLFHNSSILFLIALPFINLKIMWWYIIVVVALFFIGNFISLDYIVGLSTLFFGERFEIYGTIYESSQNNTAFLIQILIFLICFVNKDKLLQRNPQNRYLFNLLFIGLFFQSMSGMLAEMSRVSFYFCIFSIILIPRSIKEFRGTRQMLVYISFLISSLFYLFVVSGSSMPEYHSSINIF